MLKKSNSIQETLIDIHREKEEARGEKGDREKIDPMRGILTKIFEKEKPEDDM